jgi:hypothetical protein
MQVRLGYLMPISECYVVNEIETTARRTHNVANEQSSVIRPIVNIKHTYSIKFLR